MSKLCEIALTGYECQSIRNCIEADFVWNESADISPDMGLCDDCPDLHSHSNELPKQGIFLYYLVIV